MALIVVTIAAIAVPYAAVFRMAHVSGNPRRRNGDKAMKSGALIILTSIVALSVVIVIGSAA